MHYKCLNRYIPAGDRRKDDVHDEFNGFARLVGNEVNDDVHAQMRMLAVRVGTAHKDGPDEEAGHHFIRPLDGIVEKIAKNNVGIDENHAQGQRRPADDRVKVRQDSLEKRFLFHRQSLPCCQMYVENEGL